MPNYWKYVFGLNPLGAIARVSTPLLPSRSATGDGEYGPVNALRMCASIYAKCEVRDVTRAIALRRRRRRRFIKIGMILVEIPPSSPPDFAQYP